MTSKSEDAKGELLRVRREIANIDDQIDKTSKEIEQLPDIAEKERDDARALRQALWREKEQLRAQETIFIKNLYAEPACPPPMTFTGMSPNGSNMLPVMPRQNSAKTPRAGRPKVLRRKDSGLPELSMPGMGVDTLPIMSGFENDYSNVHGYEVNRSSDCKVLDVWREWKEGINGGPAIEKLEDARKKDRKHIWWKHKNDYKYWSKQMRIIHAVEQKAAEFGDSVEMGINFWEEILRIEFEGSISKLREALGGEKTSAESREAGLVNEISAFKRQRKELLQQGLDRLKLWPASGTSMGMPPMTAGL